MHGAIGRRHDPVHRRARTPLLRISEYAIFYKSPILTCTATPSGALRGVETDASLRSVLDDALRHVPDYSAVLVTGDLVQDDPSGYLRFREHLRQLAKAGAVHSGQSR